MIQLNLLPDVKLEYIKAQHQRRLVTGVSIAISLASVLLLVLMLSVSGLQKKHLKDLTTDINKSGAQLQAQPDIDKILTVQNQLGSLTALHASKPAGARLFDYLNQVTPAQVNITNFTVDFAQQTMTVTGTSDALASVNKYVDTLKFTTYTSDVLTTKQPAFSNIVLASFGINSSAQDKNQAATYTINLAYNKDIFDITQNVKLNVPQQITTRSNLTGSADLFQPSTTPKGSN